MSGENIVMAWSNSPIFSDCQKWERYEAMVDRCFGRDYRIPPVQYMPRLNHAPNLYRPLSTSQRCLRLPAEIKLIENL